MKIAKSYPAWVHNGDNLSRIQKAEAFAEAMRTPEGAKAYERYLAQNPSQVYGGSAPVAKSQPTPGDVHVNVPLTQISIAFLQSMEGFIAEQVFPNIPVAKQSDRYWTYPQGNFVRSAAQKRAPGTPSASTGYTVDSTSSYFCDPIAVNHPIPDQVRANADAAIVPDRDATELVTRDLAIKRERDWASRFFTTGIWTGSTTGGDITPASLWDLAGSTPFQDIEAQSESIKLKSGGTVRPNTMVLGTAVWRTLKHHPEFLARISGGATKDNPALVMQRLLAEVVGVERILVADAVHNPAAEGVPPTNAFVLGSKNALLCYSNPRPSLMSPSAGYIFSWTAYLAGPSGQTIRRFREDKIRCDIVEGEMAYDMKLVAAELGVFFSNVVA